MSAMTITMVEKVLADGSPCRKCADVRDRLERDGLSDRIDRILVADERDPDSEGQRIAEHHDVERAPFFVVERPGEPTQIYTIYMRLRREVLDGEADERAEASELMAKTPDLDFV
ncbi:MAG: hypothetical protein WD382_10375 [Halofilum sp. (in: g-proteobacteria)]